MESQRLRELLLAELAGGRLSQEFLRPVLDDVESGGPARSQLRLLHDALFADAAESSKARLDLAKHLEAVAVRLAQESAIKGAGCSDLETLFLPAPRDFVRTEDVMSRLEEFIQLSKDRRHATSQGLPDEVRAAVDEEWRACKADLLKFSVPWHETYIEDLVLAHCESAWADEDSVGFLETFLDGETAKPSARIEELAESFQASESRADKEGWLDQILDQESDLAVPFLIECSKEPWAQLRISVALAHRFPHRRFLDSEGVLPWLEQQELTPAALRSMAARMRSEALEEVAPADFIRRWSAKSASLRGLLKHEPAPAAAPPPASGSVPASAPEASPAPTPTPSEALVETESLPAAPAAPSVWTTHLKPFFADNWYIFAGLLMLVVGCSIVAFYTWDRHWLWRYTLLPALLGTFTFALAWLGTWIEKQGHETETDIETRTEGGETARSETAGSETAGSETAGIDTAGIDTAGVENRDGGFRGTAASLRAAAIGLLPINFMTVAFLAVDPQIVSPGILTAIVATVYLGLFGWGLRLWCRAVFAPIAALLGGALLLINALVVLRPVAESLPGSWVSPANMPILIGIGFYLGFSALAVVILVFGRRYLTKELADEKVVPWFVGGTLLATFLQVMAWVHASLGTLPQVHTYAAMAVMAGGLLLFVERRVNALDAPQSGHRSESFLGFALILLGCLMAQGNETMRVLTFLIAGAVWLYQARGRRHQAHQWIGLILLSLGVASIGILDGFPVAWRPALGFALAAAFSWTRSFARQRGDTDLATASHGMRDAVLVCASMVAVISQWSDHTQPWITASYLCANAILFFWLGQKENRLPLLHTAMVLLVLMLPYAGCVDIQGRSLHGNTMVFGIAALSLFWLLQNWLLPTRLTLRARSTVLWFYGSIAVAGMILRVVIERGTPGDLLWYRQAMDYSGPLLMAFVLVFATYFSRSLVPAIMGAVIVIILFPELQARFEDTFSKLGWGTGIGSAISALCLCILCFLLRRWSFLKSLTPGDRLFDAFEFPLRRFDYTLFTWPLLASTIFLVSRMETWTLYRNMSVNMSVNMPVETAWAVVIAGAVWTSLAAYGRKLFQARLALYLGCLSFGLGFVLVHQQTAQVFHWQVPALWTLLLLQTLHTLYAWLLAPRLPWAGEVLAKPTLGVLRLATRIALVPLLIDLTFTAGLSDSIWLVAFLGLHFLWDAIHQRSYLAGSGLFLLTLTSVLAGLPWENNGWLVEFSWSTHGTAALYFLLTVQVLHVLLERTEKAWRQSLAVPFQIGSLLLAGLLCSPFVEGLFDTPLLTQAAMVTLLLVLTLQARAWRFTGLLALSLSLGYLWFFAARFEAGSESSSLADLPRHLLAPWRLSAFALLLTLVHASGQWIHARWPRIVETQRASALDVSTILGLTRNGLLAFATGIAFFATLIFVFDATWRGDSNQLTAPYLGTLSLLLASKLWQKRRLLYLAALTTAIGNVQLVRLLAGPSLLEQGLSELHLICLGLALTFALVAAIRRLTQDAGIRSGMDRASMALAGTTLLLLTANYVIRHSLLEITWQRFLISGVLAYAAALVFRKVARNIGETDSARSISCESAYHFGVAVALWCAALLIPFMRGPGLALFALSLPVYWFLLRAELTWRQGSDLFRRYRSSAMTLGSLLLVLYASRAAFQMILFPEEIVQTLHYHTGSPVVFLIGLVLLRLHALGSGYWTGFYGGLAVMVGGFFALTSFPALRPFDHPLAGAAVAILTTYFWTLVTTQRSPLRTAIQRLAVITETDWHTLRTMWGLTLLFATQILTVIAVVDHGDHPQWVAPLILFAASLVLYHGVLRQIPVYIVVGATEVLLALHADFWVESWLDQDQVVWALLALFLVGIGVSWLGRARRRAFLPGISFATLAGLIFLHVLYHGPSSTVALWSVALLGAMTLAIPRPGLRVFRAPELVTTGLLLLTPIWLVFFSQAPALQEWSHLSSFDSLLTWPLLCALAMTLALAGFARACATVLKEAILARGEEDPCLLHQVLHLLAATGNGIFLITSGVVVILAGLLQVANYGSAFDPSSFALLCMIWIALVWASWNTARVHRSALAFTVMEICIAALFLLIRRQLLLTTELWSPLHDVWCSVGAAVLLVGIDRVFQRQAKIFIVPMAASILALPVIGLTLTLQYGLGPNVALLVVGLHSLLFSYMGRDNRESPYHILAIMGFVSFIMIVFWSKLELRTLQAYVLPVGLGILFLLQLFRARIGAQQRNGIRLVTVLAMLLSCAFYAILDAAQPVAFNLTLLLFALTFMLLGGLLRIRMYMIMGLGGILLSLGSIMYRILVGLERGSRMTLVGLLVVLTGAALVAGAIYYKTHKERIGGRIDALRKKLGDWE